jgi:hypothetical protein
MKTSTKSSLIGLSKLSVVFGAMLLFFFALDFLVWQALIILAPKGIYWPSGDLLTVFTYVFSILTVCYISGFLFPKDAWIVRPAALVLVLLGFSIDLLGLICGQVYLSTYSRSLGWYPFLYESAKYALIILLATAFSRPLHRFGSILRERIAKDKLGSSLKN